jgi:folate-binding protein YgfZ
MPIAELNDRAVVRIAGADAATLLQNVLTLDVPAVDANGSGYGALLTPQGKILWDFILHRLDDGYGADLSAGEAEAFARRLGLYKLRAKVEIAPAPDLRVFAAWAGDEAAEGRPADPRLAELGARWVAAPGSTAAAGAAEEWRRHRIALTVPEGGVDFVFGEAFPHDAAMDSLNGVAFAKGCFVGQEVVSRMRHRGTARRRIVALRAAAALPEPGADIVAGDHSVGRLGSSADGAAIGLVRLDRVRAALDEGRRIRAGGVDVEVALPAWATYAWPAKASAAEE